MTLPKNILVFTVLALQLCFINSVHANLARFLVSDQDAIQARVDLIQQAKSEILVEYFSVWNDDQSLGGMALLLEAAKRGVKVKVVLDSLSSKVPQALFAALLDKSIGPDGNKNLEIKVYNPVSLFSLPSLVKRNHAKMLIIDGEIFLTGGRNVGDKYFGINTKRNFSDLDILVKGPVVTDARSNFLISWHSPINQSPFLSTFANDQIDPIACAGKEDYDNCVTRQEFAVKKIQYELARVEKTYKDIITLQPDDIVKSDTNTNWFENAYKIPDVKFMSHDPSQLVTPETAYLSHDLRKLLESATTDVDIVSPYLIPTDNLFKAFAMLREKNVRIRIITNSVNSTDNLFAQAGYRDSKSRLVKMGVEIYEYKGPDTIHAKTAIIDHNKILIGTYNLDPRSAFLNREIGLLLVDKGSLKLAQEHKDIIEHFRSKSVLVAKDGQEYNLEWQKSVMTPGKKKILDALKVVLPLIRNQL